jgi:malonyl CoA-acyl carrier protein transacylase
MFPGQATQFVGMGRALVDSGTFAHRAEKLFDQAEDVLGYNIQRVCLYGSGGDLDDAVSSYFAFHGGFLRRKM